MLSTGDSGFTERANEPPKSDDLWVRAADVALGISALGWAARALIEHPRQPVAWALSLLNGAAGAMFLARRPAARFCSLRDAVLAIASVPLAGVALKLAAPLGSWPRAAEVLFVVCALAAVTGIAWLGRSFGVLPAVRATVVTGPYRLVRHPIYAAELGMLLACSIAARHSLAWAIAPIAVTLVGIRIVIEEKLLVTSASYRGYRERVRWRLLPGVW